MTRISPAIPVLVPVLVVVLVPWLVACGTTDPGADDDVPVAGRGLDRCAADGAALELLWNVSNLHGEIVAMTIGADGTAVLGTADGAVKQWSLGASGAAAPLPDGRPSYGDPFTGTGRPARALAIGADGDSIVAADDGVGIREWSLADASPRRSVQLKGSPFTALVPRTATEVIVADSELGGQMRVVDLVTGLAGGQFETALWGVTAFATDRSTGAGRGGESFYVVGHDYLRAAVERRTFVDPDVVADRWDPQTVDGSIRSAAVSADGAWLVTGGDGHVMVFDTTDLAAGPVATLALEAAKFIPSARSVAFTASGDHVAVALDGRVVLVTRDLTTEIASIDVATPVAVGADPSGERLVVASADGRLRAVGCQ